MKQVIKDTAIGFAVIGGWTVVMSIFMYANLVARGYM